ncbi:MAG TPA: pilus assembly PilX N-terminal domain-containing protein [Polyangia bacterium]|jgi:Tfp pilus assembly protein PilX
MRTPRRIFRHSPAHRQRGGVTLLLVMVLIVLAALVGVLAVRGASSDLQMAGSQRVSRSGFYCAEAGLSAARSLAGANQQDWATILLGNATTWYTTGALGNGVYVDIDGDGPSKYDAYVTLKDNQDGDSDLMHDNDLTVILTSKCVSTTMETNSATRTLSQIITYTSNGGSDYRYQAGHSSTHSGNEN